jgi:hypothetical protein
MAPTILVVVCFVLGVVALWCALAGAPRQARAVRSPHIPPVVAAADEVEVEAQPEPFVQTGRRVSTEFCVEHTVMVQGEVFEDIRTDVVTPVPNAAALGAAVDELLQDLACAPTVERTPVPAARRRFVRGTVLPAYSLIATRFDDISTVDAEPTRLFDDSTAVDDLTCSEHPPWIAQRSARFAS